MCAVKSLSLEGTHSGFRLQGNPSSRQLRHSTVLYCKNCSQHDRLHQLAAQELHFPCFGLRAGGIQVTCPSSCATANRRSSSRPAHSLRIPPRLLPSREKLTLMPTPQAIRKLDQLFCRGVALRDFSRTGSNHNITITHAATYELTHLASSAL